MVAQVSSIFVTFCHFVAVNPNFLELLLAKSILSRIYHKCQRRQYNLGWSQIGSLSLRSLLAAAVLAPTFNDAF
jgi:hypothetical protein